MSISFDHGHVPTCPPTRENGSYCSAAQGGHQTTLTITAAIGDLKSAAAAKKTEAEAALAKAKDDWAAASADLPKMVEAIQSRVNILSKSRSLPAGVTKDGLASAKSGLEGLKSTLSEATNAATSGDFTAAIAKAGELKAKAAEMMKSIGMKAG